MAKDKLTDYSATNASNTDVGGINIDEGMLPSAVNNALRELLTHLKEFSDGTSGIDVLSLADDDASAAMKLQAPASVTSDTTLTLPDGDGDSGQTLITNGSGTLAWAAPYGNRNLIINGAMQVAQRATSASAVNSNYVSLDRYITNVSGGGAFTLSQETDTPSGQGFKNSMKVTVDTADSSIAAGDYYLIQHRIEGQNVAQLMLGTANATKVTLSFWVKSSLTGNFGGSVVNGAADRSYPFQYNISSANTWQKITETVQLDTSGTWATNNTTGLKILFDFGSGTTFQGTADTWASANYHTASSSVQLIGTGSATWYITGLQLEVGEQATPFEHRSFADELARCQRYFYKVTNASPAGTATRFGQGHALNATVVKAIVPTPVTLRTVPTITTAGTFNVSDASTGTAVTSLGLEAVTSSAETVCLTVNVASGLTAFRPMFLEGQSGADESISIDAEL